MPFPNVPHGRYPNAQPLSQKLYQSIHKMQTSIVFHQVVPQNLRLQKFALFLYRLIGRFPETQSRFQLKQWATKAVGNFLRAG